MSSVLCSWLRAQAASVHFLICQLECPGTCLILRLLWKGYMGRHYALVLSFYVQVICTILCWVIDGPRRGFLMNICILDSIYISPLEQMTMKWFFLASTYLFTFLSFFFFFYYFFWLFVLKHLAAPFSQIHLLNPY